MKRLLHHQYMFISWCCIPLLTDDPWISSMWKSVMLFSFLKVSLGMFIWCLTHEGPATGAGSVTLGLGKGFGALVHTDTVLVWTLLQCIPVENTMSPSPWYSLWLASLAARTLMYLRIVFIWQRDVSNILRMFSFSFSLAVISRLISSNLSPTTRIISPNTVSTATFTAFSMTAPIWPRIREMVKFTSMLTGADLSWVEKATKKYLIA